MAGFLSDPGGGTHFFTGKGVRRRRILSRIEATPITLHYITKLTHDWVPFRPRGRYSFFSREEGFGRDEFCRELKQHPLHYITTVNYILMTRKPRTFPRPFPITALYPSLKAFKTNMELSSLQYLKFSWFFSYRLLSQWRKLYSKRTYCLLWSYSFRNIPNLWYEK